jgi:hypothetical protein
MADRARSYERAFRLRQGITTLGERVAAATNATVQAGPFAGLRYPADRIADIDAPVAKLLGCYEREIADVFEDALARGVEVFVDVGSADGYYAVGMALASPWVTTFAYDISRSARRLSRTIAERNEVGDRVRIRGRCHVAELASLPLDGALLLCDIEGGEAEFFDDRTVALLVRTHVVVEVHDGTAPGLGQQVVEAFDESHDVRVVVPQARELDDPRLDGWTPVEVALALTESRRPADHWLDLAPRGSAMPT